MSGATLPKIRGERSVAAFPGGAKPFAGRGGLEGLAPPHHLWRGHRLPTDIRLPPAPARSAGIRFAVTPLSKELDRVINQVRRLCWHLIHRKRSPFPSIGEGLSAVEVRARLSLLGA